MGIEGLRMHAYDYEKYMMMNFYRVKIYRIISHIFFYITAE